MFDLYGCGLIAPGVGLAPLPVDLNLHMETCLASEEKELENICNHEKGRRGTGCYEYLLSVKLRSYMHPQV